MRIISGRLLVFALCCINMSGHLAWSKPAAKPTVERLKLLERQAGESRARALALAKQTAQMEKELVARRQNLTDEAARVRMAEEELSRIEKEQEALTGQLVRQSSLLDSDRIRLAHLTAGLVRLAQIPPGGLLAWSDAPIDAARAEMLLQSAVLATRDGARQATGEVTRLDDDNRKLQAKRREVEQAALALKSRQVELASLIEKRQALYRQTESDRKAEEERAGKIADEARDLRDLMAQIEAQQQAEALRRKAHAPAVQAAGIFKAARNLPVTGEVKVRFGQNDGLGATSHGVTVITRPGATVTAPAAGMVRFAGPFRSYREILILEHPGGYLSLLAGMTRIDATVGTAVGMGEPVGLMEARPDARPELYYELRRNGQFVDPQAVALPADVRGKAR